MDRSDLKEQILEDGKYIRFRRILKSIQNQFDPEALQKEAAGLHAGRLVRNIQPKKMDPRTLIEANLREVGYRARFVEMRVSLAEHKKDLEPIVGAVRKYLYSEYQPKGLKYKEDKRAYFDRYFRQADQLMAEIDFTIDSLDHYIKDIDQAGHALTRLGKLLEMIYTREKSI